MGDAITLVSSDGHAFRVSERAARMSAVMSGLLEDRAPGADDPYPVSNVRGATLAKVIEYCTFASRDPPPSEAQVGAFAAVFFDAGDTEEPFEVALAAYFLIIDDLRRLAADAIAKMLGGKTPSEQREVLGLGDDFTPEEEAAFIRERGWAIE